MLEYKDKKISQRGLETLTRTGKEIGEMLVNKRNRSLTLYGWIVLILTGIIILNMYKGRSPTERPEDRPDILRYFCGPSCVVKQDGKPYCYSQTYFG